jgi:hypothetical protein
MIISIKKNRLKEKVQAKTILSIRSTFRFHGTPIRRQNHLQKVQVKRCSKVSSVTQLQAHNQKNVLKSVFFGGDLLFNLNKRRREKRIYACLL